jgi:hypothetical protein
MTALLLALALATAPAPACVGDGHNQHRSRSAIKKFQKAWARAHAGLPCPEQCALYRVVDGKFVLYQRCGGCQVDHVCPLACCGDDSPANMQWLTAEENRAKSDDCAACGGRAARLGRR